MTGTTLTLDGRPVTADELYHAATTAYGRKDREGRELARWIALGLLDGLKAGTVRLDAKRRANVQAIVMATEPEGSKA